MRNVLRHTNAILEQPEPEPEPYDTYYTYCIRTIHFVWSVYAWAVGGRVANKSHSARYNICTISRPKCRDAFTSRGFNMFIVAPIHLRHLQLFSDLFYNIKFSYGLLFAFQGLDYLHLGKCRGWMWMNLYGFFLFRFGIGL